MITSNSLERISIRFLNLCELRCSVELTMVEPAPRSLRYWIWVDCNTGCRRTGLSETLFRRMEDSPGFWKPEMLMLDTSSQISIDKQGGDFLLSQSNCQIGRGKGFTFPIPRLVIRIRFFWYR